MRRVNRLGALAKGIAWGQAPWGRIGNAGAVANALAELEDRAAQRACVAQLQARLAQLPGARGGVQSAA